MSLFTPPLRDFAGRPLVRPSMSPSPLSPMTNEAHPSPPSGQMFDIPSTFKLGGERERERERERELLLLLSGGERQKSPHRPADCAPVLLTRTYDISRLPALTRSLGGTSSSPSFLLFIAVILHGRADEKAIILTSARPSVRPLPHSLSQTLWSTKKLFLFSPWIWIPLLRSSRIGLLGVHVEFGRDQVGKGRGSRGAGEKIEVNEGRKAGRGWSD